MKMNAPYVDKIDIRHYANMRGYKIIVVDKNGKQTEFSPKNGKFTEVKTIYLSN